MDSVLCRNLWFNRGYHTMHVGVSLCHAHAGLKASNRSILKIVRLVLFFCRTKAHRYPQIAMAEAARLKRKFKAARHHPNNGVRTPVEVNNFSYDARVAVIASVPERITQDS